MDRFVKDKILNGITILFSSISVIVLTLIFGFILQKGLSSLNLDMMQRDYWSKNEMVKIHQSGSFENPGDFDADVFFVENYGIAIKDGLTLEKDKMIEIVYVDSKSSFNASTSLVSGDNFGKVHPVPLNSLIESIKITNNGDETMGGLIYGDNASTLADKLSKEATSLDLYYKTQGGGIRGSLIATLQLIGLSVLFAFPIGVFAAIYLVEIAKKNIFTRMLESLIELLAGVPSVVFGLMGMTVLYPIVSIFNIKGQSIVLGALTMAVILLPVIIRSVQESLITVPDGLRSASLSLGATQTQTIFKVLLPTALPGLLSALILSISRIIGESAALIFTMGTFVNDSPQLKESASTLSVHIWSLMSHEQPNFELAAAIAIIILVMVLILNLSIRIIGNRYRKKLGV